MPDPKKPRRGRKSGTGSGRRRLIAGLRITPADETLLDAVRPFFPEADSASELAYRLWRRGLELSLAEIAGAGAALPCEDALIATLVAQHLTLAVPLLRRTGRLGAVVGDVVPQYHPSAAAAAAPAAPAAELIDERAAGAIVALGGADFL